MIVQKHLLLLCCCCLWMGILQAQITFPKNGVYDEQEDHYAFTNATIYVTPDQKLSKATLLIKEGKIVAVGKDIAIPKDAVAINLEGKYIYPSFIELSSDYGVPKAKAKPTPKTPQMLSSKEGAYSWNETLKPEQDAASLFKVDKKAAKELRNLGFGTVLTHQADGMARGAAALVLLGEENEHDMLLNGRAGAHYSFYKGVSKQNYPSSRMGAIALLRQTYYDAQWYAKNTDNRPYNISLERWNDLQKLPQFFEASTRLDLLRADKLGDEFGVQYIIRSGGDEFLRLDEVKATKAALIVPFRFPKAYDVSDPFTTLELSVTQMKYWELAPSNHARLAKAGIEFAITSNIMYEDRKAFWKMARKAYQHGLSEKDLLKALTTTPAKLVKASEQIGTLEKGKLANFIVTSDNILQEKAIIHHNWVKGKPYVIKPLNSADLRGRYQLTVDGETFELEVKGNAAKPDLKLITKKDTSEKKTKLSYTYVNENISFVLNPAQKDKKANPYRLSGTVTKDRWYGQAINADGNWVNWEVKRTKAGETPETKLPELIKDPLGEVLYPWSPYGFKAEERPKQEAILFKNATVWTGEKAGKLLETDVLIEGGKIVKIGKNLKAGKAKVVDATGKHLTAGIIDEHSHICIQYGVNEGTQSSSAEVRIGDVINSEDVNMYRQLAGGVTGAQLLHGSANPIGGQSAIIKFRWGSAPEAMKYQGADGFIKFALGENVKQSNWGDEAKVRFPQTRMGVEQVYEDHFTRAKEYGEALKAGKVVRKDLELDALLEIMNKERFISCHSYVQSEITMLMRIAEKYGFTLNTFTHILEGYKVADKMKEHGAGASTFSDWWAYKYEVMDAIPYNSKILDAMDIVVAINSDDAEMGRRLNQEAAKGVKYGGMTEEAAWNMVTLNPAKLLHLDDKVGSIKEGKIADVVLWTDNPLSIYARAEQTYVDGRCLFDLKKDVEKQAYIQAERSRLVKKLLKAKADGVSTQPPVHIPKRHYHCRDKDCNQYRNYNSDQMLID